MVGKRPTVFAVFFDLRRTMIRYYVYCTPARPIPPMMRWWPRPKPPWWRGTSNMVVASQILRPRFGGAVFLRRLMRMATRPLTDVWQRGEDKGGPTPIVESVIYLKSGQL
jgi:hypothetical protein